MALDDYSYDIDTGDVGGAEKNEKVSEISERFREAVKKGSAGVRKTKKDEAKAKKYDMMLARFLVQLIIDKKYDTLLQRLFFAFDEGFSSNFLLGILSLAYEPISQEIRRFSGRKIFVEEIETENPKKDFDDSVMVGALKNRINYWVEDIKIVLLMDSSEILNEKMLKIFNESKTIIPFISGVFRFFLFEKGYILSEAKANQYSDFLASEIIKTLKNET